MYWLPLNGLCLGYRLRKWGCCNINLCLQEHIAKPNYYNSLGESDIFVSLVVFSTIQSVVIRILFMNGDQYTSPNN